MDLTQGPEIHCPTCQMKVAGARYEAGRRFDSGVIRIQELTLEPCRHYFVGDEAARQRLRISELVAAYQAGREDAAKADTPLLDALRRLRDSWYRQPGWTDAADTVDVLIDAFSEQRAAALARGQHTQDGDK